MVDTYSPVDPDFYDVIEMEKNRVGKTLIHYFGDSNELMDSFDYIHHIEVLETHEEFLVSISGKRIRLDRIITINGRPRPAYDEYDRFALECLECSGGMENS